LRGEGKLENCVFPQLKNFLWHEWQITPHVYLPFEILMETVHMSHHPYIFFMTPIITRIVLTLYDSKQKLKIECEM
jgi:hypothetical protein